MLITEKEFETLLPSILLLVHLAIIPKQKNPRIFAYWINIDCFLFVYAGIKKKSVIEKQHKILFMAVFQWKIILDFFNLLHILKKKKRKCPFSCFPIRISKWKIELTEGTRTPASPVKIHLTL